MTTLVFTLWFAVTTLFGPGVCCCSFAGPLDTTELASSHGRTDLSAPPSKSCCDQATSPCCPDGRHDQEPGRPLKCPCENSKRINSLPPAAFSDLAGQFKSIDGLLAGPRPPYSFNLGAITPPVADTSRPVSRLAGRDLLAAYSVLRC